MRAKVLVDLERPKVGEEKVLSLLKEAGVERSDSSPDFGVVVGGDGLFSQCGREMTIPLLFVGTRSSRATDSKALLSEVYLDGLAHALKEIRAGRYTIAKHRRLGVSIGGSPRGETFTDLSLEKGADSNCIRYSMAVKGKESFTDSAVSNGIVVTTRAGSTGYFSYLDKLKLGDGLEPSRYTLIGEDEVGVCHIAPTFTAREGTNQHPLRYTVPWGSSFTIKLLRDADAHLFGVTRSRKGIRVTTQDVVTVGPSKDTTNLIRLHAKSK